MAKTAAAPSVQELLGRAVALGQERARIRMDAGLHKLSREAWIAHCLELGGFADVEELQAARAKAESFPHLGREVRVRAEMWWRNGQDRPGVWQGFADGTGDRAAPYCERLVAGVTVEQCSAIAAFIVTEMAAPEHFGRLTTFAELDTMLAAIDAELAELDAQLYRDIRLEHLSTEGGRGTGLALGGHGFVGLDQGATSLATAAAAMVAEGYVARLAA